MPNPSVVWNRRSYKRPVVIVVIGPSNSGKSASIKKFLESRSNLRTGSGDVLVVIPIKKKSKKLAVGVASGGDTKAVLIENFDFLIPRNCDFLICASKTSGASKNYIDNTFPHPAYEVRTVMLTRIANITRAQLRAKYIAAVREIESNIY
jgi:GTPase SAR1 family protein